MASLSKEEIYNKGERIKANILSIKDDLADLICVGAGIGYNDFSILIDLQKKMTSIKSIMDGFKMEVDGDLTDAQKKIYEDFFNVNFGELEKEYLFVKNAIEKEHLVPRIIGCYHSRFTIHFSEEDHKVTFSPSILVLGAVKFYVSNVTRHMICLSPIYNNGVQSKFVYTLSDAVSDENRVLEKEVHLLTRENADNFNKVDVVLSFDDTGKIVAVKRV